MSYKKLKQIGNYKQLKQNVRSTLEGTIESFKMKLAFALHDWLNHRRYSDKELGELLGIPTEDVLPLFLGDLDLTLSQILKITEVIGVGVDIYLEDKENCG